MLDSIKTLSVKDTFAGYLKRLDAHLKKNPPVSTRQYATMPMTWCTVVASTPLHSRHQYALPSWSATK